MHSLQFHFPFFLPTPIHYKTSIKPHLKALPQSQRKPILFTVHALAPDELPVDDDDDDFLRKFGPKDKESEDEARRSNWIERGWAPWEEILSPEGNFARTSLNEGEEVPLQDPESIEAFKMLSPKYREEKRKRLGLTEDEWYAKQFEIKGEIPEPLKTTWTGPLVLRHVPPRDWPPEGWEVDRDELEFIREAHIIHHVTRVEYENVEENASRDVAEMGLDRYKMFVKQYKEWAAANKDRLEEDSFKYDQDDYPGRRKRGKDYVEGMYELPFYYPGQICRGKVTAVHLYQGAFVDIGGVHEGWVPIKRNDWFWIRHHIKVGMRVMVEILAKRDPFFFRFPIEMRFVDPNIDHLIFNRFDFPPIFHRNESEDINPDELRREAGRPPIPMKDPGIKWEEEPLLSNHPYVYKLWQIHNAEQMVLDDIEANPDKYKDKNLDELSDDEEFDEENYIEHTKVKYKEGELPLTILYTSMKELDLEAAFAERQHHNRMRKEAEERGEKYKISKLKRNIEMDEYDLIHWQRSLEEREALLRDISSRQALGLPVEEPGRYKDASFFGKDQYDPENPLYRYDYWGEPKNSEKTKQERLTKAHNRSIVGKGTVWYEMSYEEAMKQKMEREAQGHVPRQYDVEEDEEIKREAAGDDDDDDSDDDLDFDYSIFGEPNAEVYVPRVNGTTSSRLSEEGMFDEN